MNILICVNRLTGGGAERVASLWVSGFVARNHNVSIVVADPDGKVSYDIPEKVNVYNIDKYCKNRILNKINRLYFRTIRLRHVLNIVKPDVVITVMSHWMPIVSKAKGGMEFKIISTEHNAFEHPKNARINESLYHNKYISNLKADMVTVLTEADKKAIGTRLPRVEVLPNPLSLEPCAKIPEKKKYILAVGRFDGWYVKGFDILLKSWISIYSKYPGWELRIIGEKSETSLEQLYREIGVDNLEGLPIRIMNFKTDIVEDYRQASIFCLSSRYEGFGMVLIEAMSQGCACISSDYKGRQGEIIQNDSQGLLFAPDDTVSLTSSLETMIINEKYRESVRSNSIERARDFRLENIMNKWAEILKSI